jgi:hypothetical protein
MKAGGTKIIDSDGNEWYGYSQEEVDAECAKETERRARREIQIAAQRASAEAAMLKKIQLLVDSTSPEDYHRIVDILHEFSDSYNVYVSYMFYGCLRTGVSTERYLAENPAPSRWYEEFEGWGE